MSVIVTNVVNDLCLLHMLISVFVSIFKRKVQEVHSNCRASRIQCETSSGLTNVSVF